MTANLEEAGTWYYVVDCAICKAVVPFKHAHEDDQIVRFPTMRVRCFHCTQITRTRLTSFHAARRQPHAQFSRETDHLLTRVIEKHLVIDKKIAA